MGRPRRRTIAAPAENEAVDTMLEERGSAVTAIKDAFVVDNRPSFSTLSSRYNAFLYTPVCDLPG